MHDLDRITVLNYNEFYVITPVDNNGKTYVFTPSIDGVPSQITMPFSEVEYINGQSDAFRTGTLFFKHANPKEIYEALNIYDYDKILTNKEIENILLNPTIEGLQKIIDVRDHSTFNRIRAIFVCLKNSDSIDLSTRVVRIIEQRTEEMRLNKFKSDIILRSKDVFNNEVTESDYTDVLKEQNQTMKKQIEELQKIMSELIKNNKTVAVDVESKIDKTDIETSNTKIETATQAKKAGRPTKK